jgi:hypothetical protein
VLGQETQGDRLRLRFACGARALAELRHADRTLAQIAGGLGIAPSDVAPAVTRLASEWSATQADLAALRGAKTDLEAETMAACAQPVGKVRVVRRVMESGFRLADPAIYAPPRPPYYGRSPVRYTIGPAYYTFGRGGLQALSEAKGYPSAIFAAPLTYPRQAVDPRDYHWVGGKGPLNVSFDTGEHHMQPALHYELAHQKWPEAGFGFLLTQMREPGEDKYYPSPYWGLHPLGIDHPDAGAP